MHRPKRKTGFAPGVERNFYYNMLPIPEITKRIQAGEIVVLPTDTIYGLSCDALNRSAVERIFDIKDRGTHFALIVLVGDVSQLALLGMYPNEVETSLITKYWPGPLTIALTTNRPDLEHIHRGLDSITVRMPAHDELLAILKETGPIISTSANISGQPPAQSIAEAIQYFGDKVQAYYAEGILSGKPSTIVKVLDDKVVILRQGSLDVSNIV